MKKTRPWKPPVPKSPHALPMPGREYFSDEDRVKEEVKQKIEMNKTKIQSDLETPDDIKDDNDGR